ncbi:MAG: heme-copper oxidase subunit III [Halieaceae bacterium]|jgi:cytochrome c oxidase subunit III|nr:heme-copper oxidase subunit III [Halieaceae bacterium]
MEEATVHSEHETSPWPMVVGASVLLAAMALLSYFTWEMPVLGMVLGGTMLAVLAIGLSGWAREFYVHGVEEGVGPVAVSAFILSEVMIFGTMFVAFWLGRIENASEWASYIPEGLDAGFAVWLTLILWASSITVLFAERAFEQGNRSKSLIWLGSTMALGTLFVVMHMNEWAHLAGEGFTVGTNIYASTFYGLTGVHTSHVIVGLFLHMIVFGVVATGLMTTERITLFRGASLYWHFVDIMWLLVAANVYLIGGSS